MDYRRAYWLLFLGAGLLFGLLNYADYAEAGGGVGLLLAVLLAAVIVVVSGYAVTDPERVGGPETLGPRFAIAVVAFLLFLGLAVRRLLGL